MLLSDSFLFLQYGGSEWYLIVVVLFYISLVCNEEDLFVGLLAICVSFFVKCLLVSSALFFILSICGHSLYILDTKPLCKYLFPVVAYFFTFFWVQGQCWKEWKGLSQGSIRWVLINLKALCNMTLDEFLFWDVFIVSIIIW